MADLVLCDCGGLRYFVAPRLVDRGLPHGFTTRGGGVSAAPYDSLNLGFGTGDQPAAVQTNRARVATALGFATAVRWVTQVHGCEVRQPLGDWPAGPDPAPPAADALLTDQPALIGVRTADCLPLLLATGDGRWVAAVHAGWRGLAAGIVPRAAVALAAAAGCAVSGLLAAIGPAIGPAVYEVGPEVAAQFAAAVITSGPRGREHLHLAATAARQLRELGLTAIDGGEVCTWEHPELFYSHRRDGACTGRQAAVVAPRGR
ncbi:MAG: peptidoglycan editing factor PgeF [Fimbriimonadaceae bacterium]|nr:peptidoglycan editing factor PgeF [Fimbriimonadaceae bacterium]